LVGRPEGKRPLGRSRRRWEDNIKMDLRKIVIDGANWIQLAQDRGRWRAFVNTVMSLRLIFQPLHVFPPCLIIFYSYNRCSSLIAVTRLWVGRPRFDSQQGQGIFLFRVHMVLDLTQPPVRWVLGALTPGIKRLGCEADHWSPSSVDVKNAWSYTSTPQHVLVA
jgi:hypothetical protein